MYLLIEEYGILPYVLLTVLVTFNSSLWPPPLLNDAVVVTTKSPPAEAVDVFAVEAEEAELFLLLSLFAVAVAEDKRRGDLAEFPPASSRLFITYSGKK